MKNKFQNFNLGEVEVLTQAEQSRVKGGYLPYGNGGLIAGVSYYASNAGGAPGDPAQPGTLSPGPGICYDGPGSMPRPCGTSNGPRGNGNS